MIQQQRRPPSRCDAVLDASVCVLAPPYAATREVFFDFNGMPRSVVIADRNAESNRVQRAKATDAAGSVGAPMPGVVLETKVKVCAAHSTAISRQLAIT